MPDPLTIAAIGAAVLNGLNSSRQAGQADELQQEALDLARRDFNSRGPAREAFLNGVLQPLPEAPDLSAVFADPSNPFAGGIAPQQIPSGLDFGNLGPRGGIPGFIPSNGGMVEPGDPTVRRTAGRPGDGSTPITDPLPPNDPNETGDPLLDKPTVGDGDLPPLRGLPPVRPPSVGGPSVQPPSLPPTRFPGVQPIEPVRLPTKRPQRGGLF